jgi:hypothetical protein
MKTALPPLVILAVLLSGLYACTFNVTNPGMGTIVVNLPPLQNERAVDMAFAQANTNSYSIYAYNADRVVSVHLTSDNITTDNTLMVPSGTYKVLVIAGKECAYFGGGLATGVVVTEGLTTTVNIELDNFEFQMNVPTDVAAGSNFIVSISYDLRIPVLKQEGVSSLVFENAFKDLNLTNTGTVYSGNLSLTAPGVPKTTTVGFYGSYNNSQLFLYDTDYFINSSFRVYGRQWELFSHYFYPSEASKSINVVAGPTALTVNVTWGAE